MIKRVGFKMSALLLSASALIGASCESTTKVGSECEDGVCPNANSVTQQTCLVSSLHSEIAVTNDDANGSYFDSDVCIGVPRPVDEDGKVACKMRWSLGRGSIPPPSSAAKRCSEAPFLVPAEAGVDDVCWVAQITADEAEAGSDGWFYVEASEQCSPRGAAGVRYTAAAIPQTGTTIDLWCARTQTTNSDDEVVDIDVAECESPDSKTQDTGAACLPESIPAGGFDPRTASVEVGSDQCESEACLVYKLEGDPRPECEAGKNRICPTASEIERSVYCSCRCDAPEGDPGPLCECSEGFSCTPTIEDAPPGIRGSYCVREESLP